MSETTDEMIARFRREDQEKVERGENCSRCNQWMFRLTYPGHRALCVACKGVSESPGEVDHPQYIRCPKCGNSWDPYDSEDYGVFSEGSHDIRCGECDHEFEVETRVSYTFTSPERIAEPPRQ